MAETTFVDALDLLCDARNLIDCAEMVCSSLSKEERAPLQTTLSIAADRLSSAETVLQRCCGEARS